MREVDAMASEHAKRRALRPLRTFSDLEHERDEWTPDTPTHEQLSLTTESKGE